MKKAFVLIFLLFTGEAFSQKFAASIEAVNIEPVIRLDAPIYKNNYTYTRFDASGNDFFLPAISLSYIAKSTDRFGLSYSFYKASIRTDDSADHYLYSSQACHQTEFFYEHQLLKRKKISPFVRLMVGNVTMPVYAGDTNTISEQINGYGSVFIAGAGLGLTFRNLSFYYSVAMGFARLGQKENNPLGDYFTHKICFRYDIFKMNTARDQSEIKASKNLQVQEKHWFNAGLLVKYAPVHVVKASGSATKLSDETSFSVYKDAPEITTSPEAGFFLRFKTKIVDIFYSSSFFRRSVLHKNAFITYQFTPQVSSSVSDIRTEELYRKRCLGIEKTFSVSQKTSVLFGAYGLAERKLYYYNVSAGVLVGKAEAGLGYEANLGDFEKHDGYTVNVSSINAYLRYSLINLVKKQKTGNEDKF